MILRSTHCWVLSWKDTCPCLGTVAIATQWFAASTRLHVAQPVWCNGSSSYNKISKIAENTIWSTRRFSLTNHRPDWRCYQSADFLSANIWECVSAPLSSSSIIHLLPAAQTDPNDSKWIRECKTIMVTCRAGNRHLGSECLWVASLDLGEDKCLKQ